MTLCASSCTREFVECNRVIVNVTVIPEEQEDDYRPLSLHPQSSIKWGQVRSVAERKECCVHGSLGEILRRNLDLFPFARKNNEFLNMWNIISQPLESPNYIFRWKCTSVNSLEEQSPIHCITRLWKKSLFAQPGHVQIQVCFFRLDLLCAACV